MYIPNAISVPTNIYIHKAHILVVNYGIHKKSGMSHETGLIDTTPSANLGCVSACGPLTSGRLSIISEEWIGSSEKTMKLYTFDGLAQVGYATQRPTALVGAVCDF